MYVGLQSQAALPSKSLPNQFGQPLCNKANFSRQRTFAQPPGNIKSDLSSENTRPRVKNFAPKNNRIDKRSNTFQKHSPTNQRYRQQHTSHDADFNNPQSSRERKPPPFPAQHRQTSDTRISSSRTTHANHMLRRPTTVHPLHRNVQMGPPTSDPPRWLPPVTSSRLPSLTNNSVSLVNKANDLPRWSKGQ